jgi:hypothetical protein
MNHNKFQRYLRLKRVCDKYHREWRNNAEAGALMVEGLRRARFKRVHAMSFAAYCEWVFYVRRQTRGPKFYTDYDEHAVEALDCDTRHWCRKSQRRMRRKYGEPFTHVVNPGCPHCVAWGYYLRSHFVPLPKTVVAILMRGDAS